MLLILILLKALPETCHSESLSPFKLLILTASNYLLLNQT